MSLAGAGARSPWCNRAATDTSQHGVVRKSLAFVALLGGCLVLVGCRFSAAPTAASTAPSASGSAATTSVWLTRSGRGTSGEVSQPGAATSGSSTSSSSSASASLSSRLEVTETAVAVPKEASALFAAFGSVWGLTEGNSSTLQRIDPRTDKVTGTVDLGYGESGGNSIAHTGIAAAGGSLWVSEYFYNEVLRVDPSRLRVVKRIDVG